MVQMPSGISRLRDFDVPSLGFLKELGEPSGFGVEVSTAGKGRFFLVNAVVAIGEMH